MIIYLMSRLGFINKTYKYIFFNSFYKFLNHLGIVSQTTLFNFWGLIYIYDENLKPKVFFSHSWMVSLVNLSNIN